VRKIYEIAINPPSPYSGNKSGLVAVSLAVAIGILAVAIGHSRVAIAEWFT